MGPIAHGGGQWVGYDDPAMAAVKANYVVEMGLGGAMFWDLPSDDFNNRQYSFFTFIVHAGVAEAPIQSSEQFQLL